MDVRLVEIKARCADQEKVRGILKAQNADFKGVDHQIDTYFNIPDGRMKLREGNIENYLVFYKRADAAGPKESACTLLEINPAASPKQILTQALGVFAVVDKKREIYFIENVKFHLDILEGFGTFVEIEARDTTGTLSKEKLQEQCSHYQDLFEIKEEDLVTGSYSDMVLKGNL